MHRISQRRKSRLPTALGVAILVFAISGLGCSHDPEGEQFEPNAGEQDSPDVGGGGGDADQQGPADTEGDGNGSENNNDRPDPDSGGEWDWDDDDFAIEAIIPARGPISGGTTVAITGSQLTENTELLFGSQAVDVELSQGQLIAETPPADGSGPVTVRAISPGGEISQMVNGYTYSDPVTIDSISPSILPTTGGFEITIYGSGFVDPMGVSFSGKPARRISVISDSEARVVIPRTSRGYADIRVSIPDEYDLLEDGVYFFEPYEFGTITPAVGDVSGGQTVTISAQGITADTIVEIGGQSAVIDSVDVGAQEITVTTPPASQTGPAGVRLENEYDAEWAPNAFFYDDGTQNKIYSIQPSTAPLSGGTEHIVSGRNLEATDADILIGGQSATIVDSGAGYVVVEAPGAGTAGSVDVVLEHSGVESDRLDDGLDYRAPLSITDVDPQTGSPDGGESVTVTGQGFEDVEKVTFGGLTASFEILADDQLLVTTPEATAGRVDVIVDDGDRHYVYEDGFYFDTDLEIWSMRPARGALAGDTFVTIQGTGFDGTIEVGVGDAPASQIRRLDPWTITFRTPPKSTTGQRDVSVESMGQQASPTYPFVYFNPLSSFGGAFGAPVDGSINVSILTNDGSVLPGAFVMLSTNADTAYQGYTNANGQITLSGPDLRGPQTITATAKDFSTFTVRELNARNLTLVLNPIVIEEGEGGGGNISPPPIAHFQGDISITGKSTDPDGGSYEFNMSMVRTTRNSMNGPAMNPGPDSVVDGEGSYAIRSRVGDVALVALCGYYDADDDNFTPKLMAVQRNLTAADGQLSNVDLECDIPLDESLPIKLTNPVFAPAGPTFNEIQPFLDFGFEGVYRMPQATTGYGDIIDAAPVPAPEGVLDDISYSVIAGSYSTFGLPYTQTRLTGIDAPNQLTATPSLVGIPDQFVPTAGALVGDDIWFGLNGSTDPDFVRIVIFNALGLPVWTFLLPGDHRHIPLPEFPAFADLDPDERPEPYQPGNLFTRVYGAQIDGFDYHGFTFDDFGSARWTAFSLTSWDLRLSD